MRPRSTTIRRDDRPPLPPKTVRTNVSTRLVETDRRLTLPSRSLRFRPFTPERFHVLLNPLFKVLFNFPSRYLSAIGLAPVFSLRRSLPPASGCIPKQPDSGDGSGRPDERRQRPGTRYGRGPARGDSGVLPADWPRPSRHSSGRAGSRGGFGAGLRPASLAVTGGIPVGFFSSA